MRRFPFVPAILSGAFFLSWTACSGSCQDESSPNRPGAIQASDLAPAPDSGSGKAESGESLLLDPEEARLAAIEEKTRLAYRAGTPFPNYEMVDSEAQKFTLDDYLKQGKGFLLLAVHQEAAAGPLVLKAGQILHEFLETHPEHGRRWAVLGVLFGAENQKEAQAYLRTQGVGYRVALDPTLELAAALRVRRSKDQVGYYLVEPGGVLVNYGIGFLNETFREGFPDSQLQIDFYQRYLRRQMNLPAPMPDFQGTTYGGRPVALTDYRDRNLLVFYFNKDYEHLGWYTSALQNLYRDSDLVNLEILGIYSRSDPAARSVEEQIIRAQGLEFDVLPDPDGRLAQAMFLTGTAPAYVLVDSNGYIETRNESPLNPEMSNASAVYEDVLREAVGLPTHGALDALRKERAEKKEGQLAPQPPFSGTDALTGAKVDSTELAGRPKIVFFFNPTCPHCQDALKSFLIPQYSFYKNAGAQFIGISLTMTGEELAAEIKRLEIPFPVIDDPEWHIRLAWGIKDNQPIPTTYFVTAKDRPITKLNGFEPNYHPKLYKLLADVIIEGTQDRKPGEYLLKGYSGPEFCAACHIPETQQWTTTAHSMAVDTLRFAPTKPGAEKRALEDEECIRCHVTGFHEPDGFREFESTPHLSNVTCESCHSPGGPHDEGSGPTQPSEYETTCVTCHNATHSLNFKYAGFVPFVNHTQPGHVDPAKRKLFDGEYAGNEACVKCHARENDHWSGTAHASAFQTLPVEKRASKCATCHTTGFGQPGGYSLEAPNPKLEGVGCESCHGPGRKHAETELKADILGMGAECEFCVIEKVCASCHDSRNDPEFQLHADLEKIGHQPKSPPSPTKAP